MVGVAGGVAKCPPTPRYPAPAPATPCTLLEALRALESRCHGRQSCSLTASPDSLAPGLRDPCPATRKAVEVNA